MDTKTLNGRERSLILALLLVHILFLLVVVVEANSFLLALFILMAYLGLFGLCFVAYYHEIALASAKAFDMADSAARLAFKITVPLSVVYLVSRSVSNSSNEAGLNCLVGVSGSLALLFLIYTCGYGASMYAVAIYKRRRGL